MKNVTTLKDFEIFFAKMDILYHQKFMRLFLGIFSRPESKDGNLWGAKILSTQRRPNVEKYVYAFIMTFPISSKFGFTLLGFIPFFPCFLTKRRLGLLIIMMYRKEWKNVKRNPSEAEVFDEETWHAKHEIRKQNSFVEYVHTCMYKG